MRNAISKVSALLLPELSQEIEPELLAWVSVVLAAGKTNAAGFMANEATLTGAAEREEEEEEIEKEHGKGEQGGGGAAPEDDGIGANYFVS